MIVYERSNWYGGSYLLRLEGSLVGKTIPAALTGALIAFIAGFGVVDLIVYGSPRPRSMADSRFLDSLFENQYAIQLFGLVFGYLSISRMSISYNRYWQGVSDVKIMHSKWSDACSQVTRIRILHSSNANQGAAVETQHSCPTPFTVYPAHVPAPSTGIHPHRASKSSSSRTDHHIRSDKGYVA